jgi:hypothetical protein
VRQCKEVIDSLENYKDLHPSEVLHVFFWSLFSHCLWLTTAYCFRLFAD